MGENLLLEGIHVRLGHFCATAQRDIPIGQERIGGRARHRRRRDHSPLMAIVILKASQAKRRKRTYIRASYRLLRLP